jgi:hypothetical protein
MTNKYEKALDDAIAQKGGVPLEMKIPVKRRRIKKFQKKKENRQKFRDTHLPIA